MRLRLMELGCILTIFAGVAAPVAHADPRTSTTVDFSAVGVTQIELDPLFFKREGIKFEHSYFIAFLQGDAAIAPTPFGSIAATFTRPVTSISVTLTPAFEGTGQYTLVAFSASGDIIATDTVTVTQPPGGYFTLAVDDLPSKAKSFSISGTIEFGVSSITYTYR